MPPEVSRRSLWNGQYAWFGSKKDGTLRTAIGPDPLEMQEDDQWLIQDPRDPTKLQIVAGPVDAIRDFISLLPGKFAILTNPANSTDDEHPNGSWSRGRKEIPALNHGTKRVIVSGHFPLWPGQAIEVKDVYRLLPEEYIIVRVVSDKVDEAAPYYKVTVRCAADLIAVVDDRGSSSQQQTPPPADADQQPPPEGQQPPAPSKTPEPAKAPEQAQPIFQVGQLIRISGTPTYIPPTGIEVVPDATGKEIRKAVTLSPTEFCVLIDREGNLQRKPGPGRVFPGPYDTIQTEGSRNGGVYDAYHLRDDRGLLVRVVAPRITGEELKRQLPDGVQLDEKYEKGDEIFLAGISAYLVPGNAVEVIDPESRKPHIGNDHAKVYVQAIGVDQKSGIYVANVKTGSVELVRGEKSEVLDPRNKKHIKRRVPVRMWNLMIGHGEPHKAIRSIDESMRGYAKGPESMVETPWAVAISVPNNEAVLVTSRSGRRVVMGPRMELLAYDETLQILGLSRGRPKSDEELLETCFLKVDGNTVSDQVELQTADYVTVRVSLSYGLRFVGQNDEDRAKWFNHTNYVQFFCEHLRSMLRAEARKLTLTELISGVAEFVRDTILGEKPADGHRSGRKFDEINLLVYEVEVLDWVIPDEMVSRKILDTNRAVVTRQLDDANSQSALESKRRQNANDATMKELEQAMLQRSKEQELVQAEADSEVQHKQQELAHDLRMQQQQNAAEVAQAQTVIDDKVAEARLARVKTETEQANTLEQAGNAIDEAHAKAMGDIEAQNAKASADADVARLTAIQKGLIEAIAGANNASLAQELAKNLPAAANNGGVLGTLLSTGGFQMLKRFAEGTPMEAAFNALSNGSSREPASTER